MFEEAIHQRDKYYQVGVSPRIQVSAQPYMAGRFATRFLLPQVFGKPTSNWQVADYLEVLDQMHRMDPELRAAELYVCTAPLMSLGGMTNKATVGGKMMDFV